MIFPKNVRHLYKIYKIKVSFRGDIVRIVNQLFHLIKLKSNQIISLLRKTVSFKLLTNYNLSNID